MQGTEVATKDMKEAIAMAVGKGPATMGWDTGMGEAPGSSADLHFLVAGWAGGPRRPAVMCGWLF